jgi:hypothetical protein
MQPFARKISIGLFLIEIVITAFHFLKDQDKLRDSLPSNI